MRVSPINNYQTQNRKNPSFKTLWITQKNGKIVKLAILSGKNSPLRSHVLLDRGSSIGLVDHFSTLAKMLTEMVEREQANIISQENIKEVRNLLKLEFRLKDITLKPKERKGIFALINKGTFNFIEKYSYPEGTCNALVFEIAPKKGVFAALKDMAQNFKQRLLGSKPAA